MAQAALKRAWLTMGEEAWLSIDSGPLVMTHAAEATKRRDYEPLVHEPDENMRVVVAAREFDSWYPNDPRTYFGKTAELHTPDGKTTWRVEEIDDGQYAHTITLVHQQQAA